MKENMLTYILEEKNVLNSIIDNRYNNLNKYLNYISENKSDKWIVLATGSSANAMQCAKYYVENIANVSVSFKLVSSFVHYEKNLDDDTFVFAVSQSGRSISTIEALKKANNTHCFTLTSNEDSPINEISKEIINIGCGEEKVGYVTKGFSATVLTFILIGLETAKRWHRITELEYDKMLLELRGIVNCVDYVISKTIDWYKINKNELIKYDKFIAIGYGPSVGVINEFDTKFTETLRVNINAHELEEYMHGPYLALNDKENIIFIETNNELAKRQNILKSYIEKFNNNCYKISYRSDDFYKKTLNLDVDFSEFILPILTVIPIQYLAFQIAIDIKSDFLTDKFSDFASEMSSKTKKIF